MRMILRRLVWLALSIAVSSSPGVSQAVQGEEQALRGRVQDFYGLLQAARWSEAERYLTEDSKENYRYQSKSPLIGYEIKSVKLEAEGKTATVVVVVQTLMPAFSLTPMPSSATTRWRLVQGAWYAELPKPDPNAWKAAFGSGGSAGKPAPHPEELKFKGHNYNFGEIPSGRIKVMRFPFKNVTDHQVTITEIVTGCDCLKARIEKKRYEPGESGELAIEFDSTNSGRLYAQTLVVRTDPGDLISFLNVRGEILPPPDEPPKPAQDESKKR